MPGSFSAKRTLAVQTIERSCATLEGELRFPGTLLAACAASVLCGAFAATPADASPTSTATVGPEPLVSSNWAGYVATGADGTTSTAFSEVSARWIQPRVTCTSGIVSSAAFWVGLGGASSSSQALEQIGTAADCTGRGSASYSMWYELVPAPSVRIKYKVFPGNVIEASVDVVGAKVTLQIRNLTRRTRYTRVLQTLALDVSSAEWIAEAPTACDSSGSCGVLPLTYFDSVSFTHASATANAQSGSISDAGWTAMPIELASDVQFGAPNGQAWAIGALPSALSPDGTSFTVDWQPVPSP